MARRVKQSQQLDPYRPINWAWSGNTGLVFEPAINAPLPGWTGSTTLRDMVRGAKTPRDGSFAGGSSWQAVFSPVGSRVLDSPVAGGYAQFPTIATSQCTYALWVKWYLAGAGAFPEIMKTTDGLSTDRSFSFPSFTSVSFSIFDGSTKTATATTPTNNDLWWFLVGTADGSNVKVYVNGLPGGSTPAGSPFTGYTSPSIQCGSVIAGSARVNVAALSYWTRALSDAEILVLYEQSLRGNPDRWNWRRRSGFAPAATPAVESFPSWAPRRLVYEEREEEVWY